jgi:hypothetical protein
MGAGLAMAAQVAGTIVHLSGPLMVRKADGAVKVLGLKSEVEQGDTLVAEKNTYALIRFIDNSEITLRPGTTFTIEAFAYDSARPETDNASFNLVKGGLRSVTGLLGKRNREKFQMRTPAATIGIRGTTFVVQWIEPPAVGAPPPPLRPGLHLSVTDGAITVTNTGGALGFQAGQFGYVPSFKVPPVIVPENPGLQFVPPPAFSGSTAGGPVAGGGPVNAGSVDCEVR